MGSFFSNLSREFTEKVKQNQTEIFCGIFFVFSVMFFGYNFYYRQRSGAFLTYAQSKLIEFELKMKKSSEKLIESNVVESNSRQICFEDALKDSGFNVTKVEQKSGYMMALVAKNNRENSDHVNQDYINQAYEKLRNILENTECVDSGDFFQIRWHYDCSNTFHPNGLNQVKSGSDVKVGENIGNATSYQKSNGHEREVSVRPVTNELNLSAICFYSEHDWQVWIGGKMYDQFTNIISENVVITKVTFNSVQISDRGKLVTLKL